MSFSKAEAIVTADEPFLNKAPGTDSSEFTQNLLHETNQSFQDWLEGFSVSQSPPDVESHRHNFPDIPPAREISFEGTLTIDGYLAGLVCSPEGTLILGEKGEIDGAIQVHTAIIHGSVRGDVRATRKVELGNASKVIGDIESLELAIQPGAVFEGRCTFLQPAEGDQPSAAETQTEASLAAGNS